MGFLDLNLADAKEPVILAADEEHAIRIVDCEVRQQAPEKGSGRFLLVKWEPADDPYGKPFTHVMMLPKEDDDERTRNNRLFAIRSFLEAIGHDPSVDADPKDFVGRTAYAILGVREDDPQFGAQNYVKRFVSRA